MDVGDQFPSYGRAAVLGTIGRLCVRNFFASIRYWFLAAVAAGRAMTGTTPAKRFVMRLEAGLHLRKLSRTGHRVLDKQIGAEGCC